MLRKSIHILVLIVIFTSSSLASDNEVYENMTEKLLEKLGNQASRKKYAILPFKIRGRYAESKKELSDLVADEFTAAFIERGLNVLERSFLDQVLKEYKLAQSGISDQNAVQIGKGLGADAILTGTIYTSSEETKINARLIDSSTHEILGASNNSQDIPESKIDYIGLYFNLSVGAGFYLGAIEEFETAGDIRETGPAVAVHLKLGGSLTYNFMLHFNLGLAGVTEPSATASKVSLSENNLSGSFSKYTGIWYRSHLFVLSAEFPLLNRRGNLCFVLLRLWRL